MEEVRERVPARTTPTWEMELLVSGAAIFGLLQLPGLIDRAYFHALNVGPASYAPLLSALWLYAKAGVLILLATFLTHLWMRGYWVALVGLNSVFPGGIRWERMGLGPLTRDRFARGPQEPMDEVIERADNRATRVFGVGYSFATMILGPLLLVVVAMAASVTFDVLTGGGYSIPTFTTVFAILLAPWLVASALDYTLGTRLMRFPRLADAIARISTAYSRAAGFGPRSLMPLFASHVGALRFSLISLAVMLPVALLVTAQLMVANNKMPFAGIASLSAVNPYSATTSVSAFYADRRNASPSPLPLPQIPSRVVGGRYLELFVPYIPRLYETQRAPTCPPPSSSEAGRRARLDCLGRGLQLRIDGKDVATAFDASTDSSGQPGLLALIPVDTLAPGRHELSLRAPTRPATPGGPPRRYRIPFWK